MDKIKNMAEVDQLTNVYNRYMLEKVLDKFINQDLNTSGAIALMDIDDFKYVNDTFGHVKGDDVLKKTAKR
jgi:diguanylate cyclase (GGDEF)-like protein